MNAHAKTLRNHPLFSPLPGRVLNRLAERSLLLELSKGSVVVNEGDPGDCLFLVLTGRCQSSMTMTDGSEQIFNIYGPGDTFGERALLTKDTYWTTMRVLTESSLLKIDAEEVRKVAQKHTTFAKGLEERLYQALRTLRSAKPSEKLGRVSVFCSIFLTGEGSEIARLAASGVRRETGRSVVSVEVINGAGEPRLTEAEKLHTTGLAELRQNAEFAKDRSGLWRLRVYVSEEDEAQSSVAPFISLVSRFARYLVVHVAQDVPPDVAQEFLVQSDLPYLLLRQTNDEIYRAHLLVQEVSRHPAGEEAQLLPMVCLGEGERARPYEELDKAVGTLVHGIIHSPKRDTDQSPGEKADRFSGHIRLLSREIGRRRVGLALSAGGAKVLAHIGVIQVLEEQGIEVDIIAGTSMGGLVGAMWAFGLDGQAMVDVASKCRGRFGMWHLIDPVFPPRRGFIRGEQAKRILGDAIGDAHFSDMRRHLRVIATDIETLERVVFDSGEVVPRVHASMAMPGIVVPVQLNGSTLVDGGVSDPIPVDVLMEIGVERIIAVNTIPNPEEMKSCILMDQEAGSKRARKGPGFFNRYLNYFAQGNVLDVFARSMHGAETRVAESACQQADIVLRPISCDGRWHDFASFDKYIALGRMVAMEQIDAIKELVK